MDNNMRYDYMGLPCTTVALHNYTCALDNVWLYNMTYITCTCAYTDEEFIVWGGPCYCLCQGLRTCAA